MTKKNWDRLGEGLYSDRTDLILDPFLKRIVLNRFGTENLSDVRMRGRSLVSTSIIFITYVMTTTY